MPLVETPAIVLHAFDYSETSRILRLATRDAGLQSVIARGARRGKSRFGSAVDLFAQGNAELHLREGRDLQTLAAFDVTVARPALADDLERFTGASAIAELLLRFAAADEAHPQLYDLLAAQLDRIAAAPPERATESALAAAWLLLAELGFAPALAACAACDAPLDPARDHPFHAPLGGLLCASCAAKHPGARKLPAAERARLAAWTAGELAGAPLEPRTTSAHQRLLRTFIEYHLSDRRPLRAFEAWEHGHWAAP
ncbi:MAG TPA: DNA repair protein RecO [Gemmatimonadaceae bacterium]|nr:DNA repair protein RecO [Gemmatimonadaceae bacterium]